MALPPTGLVVARLKPRTDMSIESRCTTGAMASKKARSASPGEAHGRGERGRGEGPVATMTWSQSCGGARSPRRSSISGCAFDLRRHGGGKSLAVDRERACRPAPDASPARMISEPSRRISSCSSPDRAGGAVIGAERVGADQFGERLRLVRSRADRAHLVQHHHGTLCCARSAMPLAAREAAADDVDRLHSQGGQSKIHPCQRASISRIIWGTFHCGTP